jgi:glutaredoxin
VAALAGVAPGAEPEAGSPDLEMFTLEGCPYCAAALRFLEVLRAERPGISIVVSDVGADAAALERFRTLAARHGVERPGVPAFHVGGELIVGFGGAETTGARLRALLRGTAAPSRALAAPRDPQTVDLPFLGQVSARELGLPVFTIVLGLVDGLNPCAMWVLLFVLSLLANLRDRLRMFLIGGTFVLVSGIVYFAFMAAWLNVFLVIGLSRSTQVVLGLVAGLIGLVNVKDGAAPGRGVSLGIPEAVKPSLYARVRAVVQAERLGTALGSVTVLAVLVNLVELACTAGLPALYTQVLTLGRLPAWQYYAYLGLYNAAYVLDDAIMLTLAVLTLSRRKLQERGGRWLKLVSGLVLLALGLTLLLRPGWLAGLGGAG